MLHSASIPLVAPFIFANLEKNCKDPLMHNLEGFKFCKNPRISLSPINYYNQLVTICILGSNVAEESAADSIGSAGSGSEPCPTATEEPSESCPRATEEPLERCPAANEEQSKPGPAALVELSISLTQF